MPPKRRVVVLSACTNGWNSRSRCSSVRPMPVSATLMQSVLAAGALERQAHRALLGELERIAQQVEQDLLQAQRIADHALRHVGRDIGGELQALGGGLRRQRLGHALDQLDGRELDAFEVEAAGLDLGEVEDVVDDAQQRRRRVAHGAERFALLGRERRALEHVDHAQHAVHRRADLVAHGGEEGRLGLVGLLGFALRGESPRRAPSRSSS